MLQWIHYDYKTSILGKIKEVADLWLDAVTLIEQSNVIHAMLCFLDCYNDAYLSWCATEEFEICYSNLAVYTRILANNMAREHAALFDHCSFESFL